MVFVRSQLFPGSEALPRRVEGRDPESIPGSTRRSGEGERAGHAPRNRINSPALGWRRKARQCGVAGFRWHASVHAPPGCGCINRKATAKAFPRTITILVFRAPAAAVASRALNSCASVWRISPICAAICPIHFSPLFAPATASTPASSPLRFRTSMAFPSSDSLAATRGCRRKVASRSPGCPGSDPGDLSYPGALDRPRPRTVPGTYPAL